MRDINIKEIEEGILVVIDDRIIIINNKEMRIFIIDEIIMDIIIAIDFSIAVNSFSYSTEKEKNEDIF
jgi:hypothetical protein